MIRRMILKEREKEREREREKAKENYREKYNTNDLKFKINLINSILLINNLLFEISLF